MTRIQPLNPSDASPEIAETLSAVKAKFGMLPNVVATLAHSPGALNGYLAMSAAMSNSLLDARQREIVALAVAQANGCGYCLAAHTAIGKGAGLSADAIIAARRGLGATPADGALARFARVMTESRGYPTEADYEAFLSEGFTAAHAIDVIGLVAFNTLTNYTNHLAGTPVDFPAVSLDASA